MTALDTSDTISLSKGLQHSQSDLATYRHLSVSSDEEVGGNGADRGEGESSCSTPSPDLMSAPSASSPVETEVAEGTSMPSRAAKYRRSSPQELTVDDGQWNPRRRKSSTESVMEPPQRRRSRRRASNVLQFALATSDKSMHVPSLLERYQVCSLACVSDVVGSAELQELIQNSPRNSEGTNYKLSYEREPQ